MQCQNVPVLADLARGTHLPIATGERIFTKWGFREILEQRAASILQPDISHAGGIFEVRLIAGMAEANYAAIAPHCPLGPIAFAASVQLDACIPNFLIQEHVSLGEGYLKNPFELDGDGFVAVPEGPGLGIELTRMPWPTRLVTTGPIRSPSIPTTHRHRLVGGGRAGAPGPRVRLGGAARP